MKKIITAAQKNEKTKASDIQGFDIKINKDKLDRIDHMVDKYESSIMKHLDHEYTNKTKLPDRIADRIAAFGGSWRFIIIFAIFLVVWMLLNTLPFIANHFDPHPFILLNLCLSFIAAFQAPVIMMSQNRQAAHDKQESIVDFAINYKAEQEIDDMQGHLHRIERDIKEMKAMISEMHEDLSKEQKD